MEGLRCGSTKISPVSSKFGDHQPALKQADLLAARRMDKRSWQVNTANASIKMLPFTDIGEEQYSTYLRVT
jgi:hypothetical protein